MTDLKPNVFIGSSGVGLPIAKKVKDYLSPFADCTIWNEKGIWDINSSTFDNLIKMANFFDFGIFVATADDLTLTKEMLVIEPRDNVILEMALFLGAMGRHKSFLLVEKDIKLPSDFDGIYMPRFNSDETIKDACERFAEKIEEHYQLGHLSLYPTTALAIGYYKNFISIVVDSIQNAEPLEHDSTVFTDFKLKVVIPSDLQGSIKDRSSYFYRKHGFTENAIKTRFRRHPAWFQLDTTNAPSALMYDMPTTLTGIDEAIEMILQKSFTGRTKLQVILEQRELNNFRRVLQSQINTNLFAKDIVEIIDEY